MPQQCFISVRVGDTQKLSRLSSQRYYRFPQADGKHYGKIEVFKRIGAGSVDIDPQTLGIREVNVDCRESGFGNLKLKVEVNKNKTADQSSNTPSRPKYAEKARAAKEYLTKHGLEVQLSEAMQIVLREQPEHPAEFLAAMLMGQSPRGKLRTDKVPQRPKTDASQFPQRPNSRQKKLSPLSEPGLAAPTCTATPAARQFDRHYYLQNFRQMSPSAWSALHKNFPARAKSRNATAPVPRQFDRSYYMQNFRQMGALAFKAIHSKFPPVERKPPYPPSVGTWIMALPVRDSEARKIHSFQKPSVGTWAQQLPARMRRQTLQQQGLDELRQRARAALCAGVEDGRLKEACAISMGPGRSKDPAATTWTMLPSVGTWLQHRLVPIRDLSLGVDELKMLARTALLRGLQDGSLDRAIAAADGAFANPPPRATWMMQPSVGTWLTHRVSKPPPSKEALEELRNSARMALRQGLDQRRTTAREQLSRALAPEPVDPRCDPRIEALRRSAKSKLHGGLQGRRQQLQDVFHNAPEPSSCYVFRPSVGSWLARRLLPETKDPKASVAVGLANAALCCSNATPLLAANLAIAAAGVVRELPEASRSTDPAVLESLANASLACARAGQASVASSLWKAADGVGSTRGADLDVAGGLAEAAIVAARAGRSTVATSLVQASAYSSSAVARARSRTTR